MLYIIGLGLSDEKDITIKGLEAIKSCSKIYLEAYTSILMVNKQKLELFYEKEIQIADRDFVELEAETILTQSIKENIAFLVVGDPYGATTHSDLVIRAKELNIPVKTIHNASIMNAIGCCGLSLYNFGPCISIVFFTETWKPDSFYDKIKENKSRNIHTLCLLGYLNLFIFKDIKVKEQSIENMVRGKKIYEPPRYMSINQACQQLLEIESIRNLNITSKNTIGVGLARVGCDDQLIVSGTLEELALFEFGEPLHCLIIPGMMHFMEATMVRSFAINKESFDLFAIVSQN